MSQPRKRRRPSRRGAVRQSRHTSHPTGRAAYAETRRWLLDSHGPVCAYCGGTFAARTLTLDHVTPRRGQTAYDRRDNLVLACKPCNSAKADKPFLAYLLANKARARHLYVYGQHLSHGILDMLRHMVGDEVTLPTPATRRRQNAPRLVFARSPDEESPYLEESPYREETAAATPSVATPPPSAESGPRKRPAKKQRSPRKRRAKE
ncbi:MAG: HNH endonuclease signature motif containing protein [Gemmatimonadaceae bacterium]